MNKRETLPKIIKFFKKYDQPNLQGCAYYELGNDLFIVMAQDEEDANKTVAKIAYNCDDLQSDYALDWYEPVFADGEAAFTELSLSYIDYKNQASWFYDCYKAMVREIKAGNLFLK